MSLQLLTTLSPTEELETCNACLGDGYIEVPRPIYMSVNVPYGYIDYTRLFCHPCAGTGAIKPLENTGEYND
jgi:hypothetical protein